jgi:hypothetical protein
MLTVISRKGVLAVLTLALFALAPAADVLAQGVKPPPHANDKVEQAWAHELVMYSQVSQSFDKTAQFIAKTESLIHRAAASGKNVSAAQSALNAYIKAVAAARPPFASARTIVNAHLGFDGHGKVTGPVQANATMKALRLKLQQINFKLHQANKLLRNVNMALSDLANQKAPAPTKH